MSALDVGEEFTSSSVYSSNADAYFLLPSGYNVLSGEGFGPGGPGEVPTLGTVEGWAKYGYDGTSHFTFSELNVPVAAWNTKVGANDTSGLLTAALSGNDTLTGGALADELLGFDGEDELDGGAGADTMVGGAGNDTYLVDNVGDRLTEAEDKGTDAVQSSATHTLAAHVENLTLTGTAAIDGTGNDLVNSLQGNASANVLDGRAGSDGMIGGDGNDTYVVDNALDTVTEAEDKGTDAVQSSATHTLAAHVEDLTLTGTAAIDGTGNVLVNRLTGNVAANTLDGKEGADTMAGGAGNDTYVLDDAGDTVTEAVNAGSDTVLSPFALTLGVNVENLTLTGSADIAGIGNTLANILVGNAGENALNGGVGADMMFGGADNDTYTVDNAGDRTLEALGAGTDSVTSTVSHTLGANVENLTLTGTAAINGTGNAIANTLTGNPAANVLTGGAETDSLSGAAGNDTLRGDAGNDTLDGGLGADAMAGGADNDTYHVDNIGDRVTELAPDGLDGVNSTVTYTLGANVENLTLHADAGAINGTGNDIGNLLQGNASANVLDGRAGNDGMSGGNGNDTYVVDAAGDIVTELAGGASGIDTVQSSATFILGANVEHLTLTGTAAINGTGNAESNTLTGNAAANTLDGAAGIDTMVGGAGNDTYVVDAAGDTVTEAANAGTDSVTSSVNHTLGLNVENLTLTGTAANGTGNVLGNTLTGNAGANELSGEAGNDVLDGGAGDDNIDGGAGNDAMTGGGGADTIAGGAGDDTYVVDGTDVLTENASEGVDTVRIGSTYTLGANFENLTLTGDADIDGTGNELVNTLTGNGGNNILDGDAGTDAMVGGTGNDTYLIDDVGDRVTEAADAGTDKVESAVDYTLGVNVEDLTLTGSDDIDGTGNTGANVLNGNDGTNTLTGGAGDDTLDGGAGADTFAFAPGFGRDTISGWEAGDKIAFDTDLGVANFADLDDNGSEALDEDDSLVSISGGDTVIDFGDDVLTIDATTDLDSSDFIFVA